MALILLGQNKVINTRDRLTLEERTVMMAIKVLRAPTSCHRALQRGPGQGGRGAAMNHRFG